MLIFVSKKLTGSLNQILAYEMTFARVSCSKYISKLYCTFWGCCEIKLPVVFLFAASYSPFSATPQIQVAMPFGSLGGRTTL